MSTLLVVAILALATFMPRSEGIRFAGSCAGGRMATEHSLQNDLQGLLEIGSICLPPGPIVLEKPIVIDESVNIEGAFPFTTLQCPPGGSAFIIKAVDVNMTRLNFTGCENGPAVVVEGDADTAPCKGTDRKACVSDCLAGNLVVVNGSIFEGCTGTKGGAISVTNGRLVVSDSEFSNNSADQGGAIYAESSCVFVNDSSFTSNTAKGYGGAVELRRAYSRVSKVKFIGNSAANGGAISTEFVSLSLDDTVVAENEVSSMEEGMEAGMGGGFMILRSLVQIERTNFTSNTAVAGGALRSYDADVAVILSNFTGNQAERSGAFEAGVGGVQLINTIFAGNVATRLAGGALIYACTAEVTLVLFENNVAEDGGGLYIDGCTAEVATASFAGNNATVRGGAVWISEETATLTDVEFYENKAKDGGALAVNSADILVTDVGFVENAAEATGGALWLNGTDAALTKVFFASNQAPEGAAIQVLKSNVTTTNVNMSANAANALGGMFELTLADATLKDPEAATIATASSGQRTLLPTK